MQKVADLHVHTHLSDGTFSPEKAVEYAKMAGLDAIAITDHDSCEAITPAIVRGEGLGVEVIPGVELTAEWGEDEIHILGYFIDWRDDGFKERLASIAKVRQERAKKILALLRERGIEINYDELLESGCLGSIGRLHIANLLYKKGAVSSLRDAFGKYIGNDGPCYVKKFKLSPREAIDMIKGVGGVSVLAHPKTINLEGTTLEDAVKTLVRDGIQGMEVYHSDHNAKDARDFMALAEKNGLLAAGGSDCHGLGKGKVLMGKVKIPYELVERLRKASRMGNE
ncbi:MAG: PHP domain-containing protein [Candidatus Omnitrophota bacterium]